VPKQEGAAHMHHILKEEHIWATYNMRDMLAALILSSPSICKMNIRLQENTLYSHAGST
jgi:hypothetical protein